MVVTHKNIFNASLFIDSYKSSHQEQYPDNTTRIVSNFTPRTSRLPGVNKVLFFGLQSAIYQLNEFFNNFFHTPKGYEYFEESINNMLGKKGPMEHIRQLHKGGRLPIKLRAIPEGSLVNIGVPLFTVENTLEDYPTFWVTNFIETALTSMVWHPTTVATIAYQYKKLFTKYLHATSDADPSFVNFQGHDFSARGHTHPIASALSGQGHLTCFQGTDTVGAIAAINEYYTRIGRNHGLIGASVPATEHSVMSAFGDDTVTFSKLLKVYPTGIVSVVSDTWDFWFVVTELLPKLKEQITARDGKLVIRPDSGDPVKIIIGDPQATTEAERKGLIACLMDTFGYTVNSKGFKVLNPKVGAIYGDSITLDIAQRIMEGLYTQKVDTTCIVLGIGSYTYQYVTRDTFGFAMKATWAEINGQPKDLFKKPKTDNGGKFSIKGLPFVTEKGGDFFVQQSVPYETYCSPNNQLKEIKEYDFVDIGEIRARVDSSIKNDLGL